MPQLSHNISTYRGWSALDASAIFDSVRAFGTKINAIRSAIATTGRMPPPRIQLLKEPLIPELLEDLYSLMSF
jgi:hypothetical protein